MIRSILVAALLSLAMSALVVAQQTQPAKRLNVLFIIADDLRPELGCYGATMMHTPNIDRLAASGVRFTRQFVTVPMCGPSRAAMLTGKRPSQASDLGNDALRKLQDQEQQGPESVVDLFRRSGYRTVGLGKVSHYPDGLVYGYDAPMSDTLEMPRSWDDMSLPYGKWQHGWRSFFGYADGTGRPDRLKAGRDVPAFEAADVPDIGYPDGLIAQAAVEKLKALKARGQPFFLAVGFSKPHLPFNAPKRYWDLYPQEQADVSPAPDAPSAVHPNLALHPSNEMAQYTHPADWRKDAAYHRTLRRAYRAAVSYMDAQVGIVLDALAAEGLGDDTIVVFWGDHGFHLGDLTIWGKHSLFDWSLRSPLIVRVPGTAHAGKAADGLVESLDIYPTLTDLCGLETPEGLHGQSLRPLLEDPSRVGKRAAVQFWSAGAVSVRTDRHRLTRYQRPQARGPVYELYDVVDDPHQTRNIAADQPEIVKQLMAELPESVPSR